MNKGRNRTDLKGNLNPKGAFSLPIPCYYILLRIEGSYSSVIFDPNTIRVLDTERTKFVQFLQSWC